MWFLMKYFILLSDVTVLNAIIKKKGGGFFCFNFKLLFYMNSKLDSSLCSYEQVVQMQDYLF